MAQLLHYTYLICILIHGCPVRSREAATNLKAHRVSFADAEGVLFDPLAVTIEDLGCVFQPIVDAVSAGTWTAFQRNVDGISG